MLFYSRSEVPVSAVQVLQSVVQRAVQERILILAISCRSCDRVRIVLMRCFDGHSCPAAVFFSQFQSFHSASEASKKKKANPTQSQNKGYIEQLPERICRMWDSFETVVGAVQVSTRAPFSLLFPLCFVESVHIFFEFHCGSFF